MDVSNRAFILKHSGVPFAKLSEIVRGVKFDLVFDPSWIELTPRPVFSIAAIDWRLHRTRRFSGRLPAFLSNLLPERNGALRRRISRAAEIEEDDDLALLGYVGGDMAGAITAHPCEPGVPSTKISVHEEMAHSPSNRLRWSLAGIQLKFSVARSDRMALSVKGRGSKWILKLPDAARPSLAREEFAIMEWARQVGFEVPLLELVDPHSVEGLPSDALEGITEALLVRRFDRDDEGRSVHMEEFASALQIQPEHKYCDYSAPRVLNFVSLGRLVKRFTGVHGLETFIRRIVFDVIAGNGDAHLKNWAFIFPDGRTPKLAPAYDVFPTVLYSEYAKELALAFTSEKGFYSLDTGRLRGFARKIGIDEDVCIDIAMHTANLAKSTFDASMATSGLAPTSVNTLREHWKRLPLLRYT